MTLESTYSTTIFLFSKVSSYTLSNEVVQDEEEVESSTQSIRIEESLLAVTPSPAALEVYEISDISSSHMDDIEEDIRISNIEEKISFHSMQTFSSDSPLNYVQSLPMIASKNAEEFNLSLSNVDAGVKKSNNLYVFEEISYFRSDPLTLIDL